VKPARFEYVRPESLKGALEVLAQHGSDAAVLAGGQSLMPMLNLRMAAPAVVVDINRIPELDRIATVGGQIEIGSRARHNDVLRSPIVNDGTSLITEALRHVAHEAIRNRGTLGGSLALADPAAEMPACAVCLGAEIVAASVRGERRIAAEDFFEGLYATALAPDELLVKVRVPAFDKAWRFGFEEVARRHGDFALAGLALGLRVEGSTIVDSRIVFAAIEPTPKRAREAERRLVGADILSADAATRAGGALADDLEPLEGGGYPAAYRLHLARVLLSRLLERIAKAVGQS
jgi:aerobic carbon-monoxide dehydrogenase medium subunit